MARRYVLLGIIVIIMGVIGTHAFLVFQTGQNVSEETFAPERETNTKKPGP